MSDEFSKKISDLLLKKYEFLKNEIPKIIHYEITDSTNVRAKSLLEHSQNEEEIQKLDGIFLFADEQISGHGRLGRNFYSPAKSGIYFTEILSAKNFDVQNPAIVTVSAAVAVSRAIYKVFKKKCGIKWVNDLFIGKKKVCGILAEAFMNYKTGNVDAFVLGIGINLSTDDFPEDVKTKAGSITNSEEANFFRYEFCAELIFELKEIQKKSLNNKNEYKNIINEYKNASILIGKTVLVTPVVGNEKQKFFAEVLDITEDAKLKVKTESGEIKELDSGEVSLH